MHSRSPKSLDFGVFIFPKTENFNAIIAAYEEALIKFQDAQAALDAEQQAKEGEAKEKQGNFYRYMETDVLKHDCIAYLL